MTQDETPLTELPDEELIQKLFPQEVIEKVREITREGDDLDDSEEPLEE